ncbi:MAG: hypothetical protein ACI83O_000408 [Patescibacteria group bacterium]|jgi:uncharacterized protein (TIGR00661 family)
MRILYGICGEGYGHSSRAQSVIEHLQKQGHEVMILTYAQALETLQKFNPVDIFGIEVEYRKGKMSILKSLYMNNKRLVKKIMKFPKLKARIDRFNPDICISDMEPIVPIISFWYKLPLISIDNQHELIYRKQKVPFKYKIPYLIAKTAIKRCIARANSFIILSFTNHKSNKKNVHFVNPIIRNEVLKLKPKEENFVLVYLSKPDSKLIELLKKRKEKYRVYGQQDSGKEGNIKYKKKGPGFLRDVQNCRAIVATAGFSLISEALYLKKPYFAIPIKGQFEQYLNGVYIEESGFGIFSEDPKESDLDSFYRKVTNIKKKMENISLNPNKATQKLDFIIKGLS